MKLTGAIDFDALEAIAAPKFAGPGKNTVGFVVSSAIPIIMFFAGVSLLVMAIMSGFNLITSAGDPQKAKAAKSRLTNAVLGLVVVIFAYWIVQLFGVVFSINQIKDIF